MKYPTTKPYLIRAIYEWCVDNNLTAYISVEIDQNKFSNTAALIFQLYTNTGTTAYQEVRINQATQKIPLNNLNPGLYFYQLKDEDDLLQSGKVVIE